MRFTTEVGLPLKEFEISHKASIMLMGSCFAHNIGERLLCNKFNVDVNPFGILYNPLSIATALRRIAEGLAFDMSSPEVFNHNNLWHSTLHHGDFSCASKEETIKAVNERLLIANEKLNTCDVVMITFGTAYIYRGVNDGKVVGNCHKLPQSMFVRSLLSVPDIVNEFSSVMKIVMEKCKKVKFLFTVSPIRHLRDGAHDNQLSKATLLLAIEELRRLFPENTLYFPSYEIVLDELRDYRFYADDMIHPSAVAVDYLWECFAKCYFSQGTVMLNDKIMEISRALLHKPFNAESDEYRKFIGKILLKITELKEKYPYFDFEKEILQCSTLLNR